MNGLAEKNSIFDITPDNLNNDLLASLVGYETINVYNNIVRLMPFNKIIDSAIKASGERAFETTQHWIKNVETPFAKTFLAIDSVFLKDEILQDLDRELNAYIENKTPGNLKEIAEIVRDCKNGLSEHSQTIENTNKEVDRFRELISTDSQNFQDIEQRLPDIIKDNNEKITEIKEKIKNRQEKITTLTTNIRKKYLQLVDVEDDIGKAGIACAIPIVNLGGAIAMAVLLGKKSSINQEIKNLEDELDQSKKMLIALNERLDQLNNQAPLLTSMITQIPLLFTLSIKSAEIAHAIKVAWNTIAFGLDELNTTLVVTAEHTNRALKKLTRKIKELENNLTKLLSDYNNSMRVGYPVDVAAQAAFKLSNRIGSKYYFSNSQTGIVYLPRNELYEITGKIHASY